MSAGPLYEGVFDFASLHRELVRRLPEITVGRHVIEAGDVARAADLLGVTTRTVHRWKHAGLSPVMADRVATRLGSHPAFIWRSWDAVNDAIEGDDLAMLELQSAS